MALSCWAILLDSGRMDLPLHAHHARPGALSALAAAWAPALAAMAYPWLLAAFHATFAVQPVLAALLLLGAFAMPGLGLLLVLHSAGAAPASVRQIRARQLALLGVAAPPLFVFTAFLLGVLGHPVPETWVWTAAWLALGLWASAGGGAALPAAAPPAAAARVAHGVVAALVLVYVLFHLANHLFGLVGPAAHAAVMRWGRRLYRAPAAEVLLVGLLLCQVALGGWLAWRWSRRGMDRHRAFQLASGVYLGFFVLTHMNSALVSARALHGIATDWAWASGAPTGLLRDAWSIRLVPHYALGVFFVLAHLASGLRVVLTAHGLAPAAVSRAWAVGLLAAALVSAAIVAGLCGLRIV